MSGLCSGSEKAVGPSSSSAAVVPPAEEGPTLSWCGSVVVVTGLFLIVVECLGFTISIDSGLGVQDSRVKGRQMLSLSLKLTFPASLSHVLFHVQSVSSAACI